MNNKRTVERIAIIALAAFLIGYFCYQVAYGMTMGPNGTMIITQGNVSATLRAPPGSTISNFTIRPEGPPVNLTTNTPVGPPVMLANDTWTIYNSTSGSTGTITFHNGCKADPTNPGYQGAKFSFTLPS